MQRGLFSSTYNRWTASSIDRRMMGRRTISDEIRNRITDRFPNFTILCEIKLINKCLHRKWADAPDYLVC